MENHQMVPLLLRQRLLNLLRKLLLLPNKRLSLNPLLKLLHQPLPLLQQHLKLPLQLPEQRATQLKQPQKKLLLKSEVLDSKQEFP